MHDGVSIYSDAFQLLLVLPTKLSFRKSTQSLIICKIYTWPFYIKKTKKLYLIENNLSENFVNNFVLPYNFELNVNNRHRIFAVLNDSNCYTLNTLLF